MKRCILLVFLLTVMSVVANSETVLEYDETDYINLRPAAYDPDNDSMTYFFSPPLSSDGTWQTTYGDEGIYNTKGTVSDGKLIATENITLIIHKKDMPPNLEIISPKKKMIYMEEGQSIFFNIRATDTNKDNLNITWLVDEVFVSDKPYYNYKSDFYSQGNHTVAVLISDGLNTITNEWLLEVADFDRETLLDEFKSITVNETDIISFILPDFKEYSLLYNISEPLGIDARWETTYDDAGIYSIIINIWDNELFVAEKRIKVLVENVDRPAEFLEKESYFVSEDEEIEIFLNYTDPDGDRVNVIVYDLPDGASYKNRKITWKPDFDTVTQNTVLDDIARKYHLMNELFTLHVNVFSNELVIMQYIKVSVFNKNRPPILEAIPEITLNEGETINYDLNSSDPDNDALTYSFKGFKDGQNTKIGDAGTYNVEVTVSDGFLMDTKYTKVIILPVNSPPKLDDIFSVTIDENHLIEISLNAKDIDNDPLTYSVSPLPKGAYIKENKFIWSPDYDTVSGEEKTKTFNLTFKVSDSYSESTKNTKITVNNINRQPVLTTFSQVDGKEFYIGEEVTFFVDIFDPDYDAISYNWQTSLFNTFKGNNTLIVKYDSPGKKNLLVAASDGKETVQMNWEVIIKKKPQVILYQINQ